MLSHGLARSGSAHSTACMSNPRHLRLPELRRGHQPLAGQLRRLRRVEHASSRRARRLRHRRRRSRARRRQGPPVRARGPGGRSGAEPPRTAVGIAELDRVTGGGFVPGLGHAARRRAGHRQVDPADPGLRRARPTRRAASPTSRARRRSARCGCAPSGSGSPQAPVELAAATSVEDIVATLGEGAPLQPRRHRFDPDDVDRDRSRPRPAPSPRCAARPRR